jgi:hypothetical protein
MSKQGKNALNRKLKMQEKMKEMEEQIKQLEEKAQIEIGKHVLKTWEVNDDHDSKAVFDVIRLLKDDAIKLLNEDESELGKSDVQETQKTP